MIPRNIIISTRGHKLGDVIFSLPIATLLKNHFPNITIGFIGTPYTRSIIEACQNIDVYIDKEAFLTKKVMLNNQSPDAILHVIPDREVARRANQLAIPLRIGTSRRLSHWLTCNRLVYLSRRNSSLHEIQLNLKILKAFDIPYTLSLEDIANLYALTDLSKFFSSVQLLEADKFKIIIHAKSGGSAKEWSLQRYIELINLLDLDKFQIFISGSIEERQALEPLFQQVGHKVTDVCGKLNLNEFIGLISLSDGLIACSTGPLHLAAALGKYAFGLYAPRSPIFAQRWGPVGKNAQVFTVKNENCGDCRENNSLCPCIESVMSEQVAKALENIINKRVA